MDLFDGAVARHVAGRAHLRIRKTPRRLRASLSALLFFSMSSLWVHTMNTPPEAQHSAEVIIVGSGAGGAAAAYALAKRGLRVLILEKGTPLPKDGSTLDIDRVVHSGQFLSHERWMGRRGEPLTPEEHFNLGGKTKWYGAALLRFSPQGFDADLK